jgi:hypothetical protein
VSKLHKLKTQRNRRKGEVAADRNALPDMQTLEKNVEQATQKVTELTRMLEEARLIAASACNDHITHHERLQRVDLILGLQNQR